MRNHLRIHKVFGEETNEDPFFEDSSLDTEFKQESNTEEDELFKDSVALDTGTNLVHLRNNKSSTVHYRPKTNSKEE